MLLLLPNLGMGASAAPVGTALVISDISISPLLSGTMDIKSSLLGTMSVVSSLLGTSLIVSSLKSSTLRIVNLLKAVFTVKPK